MANKHLKSYTRNTANFLVYPCSTHRLQEKWQKNDISRYDNVQKDDSNEAP